MLEGFSVTEATWQDACRDEPEFAISESSTSVARGVAGLAADPDPAHWSGEILTSRQLSGAYGTTDVDGSRPDCYRYLVTQRTDASVRPTDFR
jgi:hypothetical protein